jgi:hypothetical protein
MSQLIWMINLIPDMFWTLLLWAGVLSVLASYLLGKIPFVSQYRIPLRVGGVVAVLIGVYFYGVIANEAKWQAKIKELEEKVAIAEAKSADTNTVVKTEIVEKIKVIKQKAEKQIEYVDRVVKGDTVTITKDMGEAERAEFKRKQEELERALKMCPVPQIVIEEINKAAKGVKQ